MQKNKIYYIDYENVIYYGLEGIDLLSSEDIVYVFYTGNPFVFPFELAVSLNKSKSTIEFIQVHKGGLNSLDFQLISQLFYDIGKETKEKLNQNHYYIITKDKGFEASFHTARKINILLSRAESIKESLLSNNFKPQHLPTSGELNEALSKTLKSQELIPTKSSVNKPVSQILATQKNSSESSMDKNRRIFCTQLVKDMSGEKYKDLDKIIIKYCTTEQGLDEFHQKLLSCYGFEVTKKIYPIIKPNLKSYKVLLS